MTFVIVVTILKQLSWVSARQIVTRLFIFCLTDTELVVFDISSSSRLVTELYIVI